MLPNVFGPMVWRSRTDARIEKCFLKLERLYFEIAEMALPLTEALPTLSRLSDVVVSGFLFVQICSPPLFATTFLNVAHFLTNVLTVVPEARVAAYAHLFCVGR